MADAKHTPGPWEAPHIDDNLSSRQFVIYERHGAAERIGEADEQNACAEANARLIAAAPELLEACKAMIYKYGGIEVGDTRARDFCNAAIAKATGSTE